MPEVFPLERCRGREASEVGGKARNLAELISAGFSVPEGICLPSLLYDRFVETAGARDFISFELGRKALGSMRWEEMWDASLRIRNFFVKASFPPDLKENILRDLKPLLQGGPVAVRSSSVFEDSQINSYAGLHESFLGIKDEQSALEHVKLVWASLWSDAAIAYSRELGLDPQKGKMAVVIQRMLSGAASGVAFGVSPVDESAAVIEAVSGLNKGLVDGDVEPDRWTIDRATGKVRDFAPAGERKKTVAGVAGTFIVKDTAGGPAISGDEAGRVYDILMDVEKKMGYVPDMEWTMREGRVWILQVRPVTRAVFSDEDKRRGWDMTLRRSFDNLRELSVEITEKLIPEMTKEAVMLEEADLEGLDDQHLAEEVRERKRCYEKWKSVYWEEFIPFAHGARLFGQIYNDRMRPEDPFEFIDIISSGPTESVRRNRRMEDLAGKIRRAHGALSGLGSLTDADLLRGVDDLIRDFPGIAGTAADEDEKKRIVLSLLEKIAAREPLKEGGVSVDGALLEKRFLDTYSGEDRRFAEETLALAKTSYRLRDDDNVYLGRIETQLSRALDLSRKRLGERCRDERACSAAEEVIAALKMPDHVPKEASENADLPVEETGSRRQIRGQPAGKGIARGRAKVIRRRADLFDVESGQILVCDSIDPEMTFVIPVVSGIIERRGGMLIHGAIIAREYGIPCVTGVEGATEHISDGDDVTVDGYFGLVINHSVGEGKIKAGTA